MGEKRNLLCLDTTLAGLFCGFDGLLVGLWVGTTGGSTEHGWGLEGSLQVAGGRLVEDVDLDLVVFQSGLDWGHDLHEQRVGVLHVQVHETHHGETGVDGLDGGVDLLQVVVTHGGDFEFFFGLATQWVWWSDVFQGGQVVLLDNLGSSVRVDGPGDDDGCDVGDTHVQYDGWVFHIQTTGDLHHDQHDG